MFDVIIIGGGPAGMMAGITAAKRGCKVLLLEKNNSLGKKLLLTGGGRCNLTNLKPVKEFISELPINNKLLYSALSKFGPQDIYDYFQKLGVKLKIEDNDRVFPVSNQAATILEALLLELDKYKVKINYKEAVIKIDNDANIKTVYTNKGEYQSKNIIIACGGCSYPNTGSNGDSLSLAKHLKQPTTKVYPVETALVLKDKIPLAGLAIDNVTVSLNKVHKNGSLLVTHSGLSGPVILNISEKVYLELETNRKCDITIDFLPDIKDFMEIVNNYNQKSELKKLLREYLTKKLADYLIEVSGISAELKIASISKINKLKLVSLVKNYTIAIKSAGSIAEAFVTGGGIDLKDINMITMESKINNGIYFIGEALDIHGPVGGYNITLALTTGYSAGYSIK